MREYGIAEFYVAPPGHFRDGVYRFDEIEIDVYDPWFTDGSGYPIKMTGSMSVFWRREWYEELDSEFDKINLKDWYERGRRITGGFSVVYALIESENIYELDGYPPSDIRYRIVKLVDMQALAGAAEAAT